MLKIILILLVIIILLTAVKNFLRRYRNLSSTKINNDKNSRSKKTPGKEKDDDIVDAKFEELK